MPNTLYIKPASLIDLDDDVIRYQIGPRLNPKALNALSNSCRLTRGFFQQDLAQLKKQYATQIVTHILHGEDSAAMALINKYPQLLFCKTEAHDFALGYDGASRTIVGSPFQAIIGAGDITLINWLYNTPYLYTDRALAEAQFREQFPKAGATIFSDYDEKEALKVFDRISFSLCSDPFVNGEPGPGTENALKSFRDYFSPKRVEQGLHFDLRPLIKAFEIYNADYKYWTRTANGTHINSFYWCRVVGYLERLVSTFDAQLICVGFPEISDPRTLTWLNRALTFDYEHTDYYPSQAQGMGLGYDFAVYSYDPSMSCTKVHLAVSPTAYENTLRHWADFKQQSLATLYAKLTTPYSLSL